MARILPLCVLAACLPYPEPDDTDNEADPVPVSTECIQADGDAPAGGFATLQEAVDAAESVVSICATDEDGNEVSIEETVTITNKKLTLSGAGTTRWTGATNEPTLVLRQGADVTVSGLVLGGTRTAIDADASALTLNGVVVDDVNQWGVSATGSDVVVLNSTVKNCRSGGIQLNGGTFEIRSSTFDANKHAGIEVTEGANGTVTMSTVLATALKNTETDTDEHGWGLIAKSGAAAVLTGNVWLDNQLGAIRGEGSELTLDNETIEGGVVGIWAEQTPTTGTAINVQDVYRYGVVAISTHLVTLTGFDIVTDPNTSAQHSTTADGSIGIIAIDSNLALTDGFVFGHNTAGIQQDVDAIPTLTASLESVTVDNSARIGIGVAYSDATFTDVHVTDTRSDPTCEVTPGTFACNFGILASSADITWTGGTIADNDMWGLVSFDGAIEVRGLTVRGNGLYGLYSQEAALDVADTTFEDGAQASISVQYGYAEIRKSSFLHGSYAQEYDGFDSLGNPTVDVYHYDGLDIIGTEGTVLVEESTFEGGDEGIYAYRGSLTVTDSSFVDYRSTAIRFTGDVNTPPATVARVTFEGVNGSSVACSGGAMMADHLTITDQGQIEVWYEHYVNGSLESETRYEYATASVDVYNCEMSLDETTIDDAPSYAVNASNAQLELTDLTVSESGRLGYDSYGAINAYYWGSAPDVRIYGLHLGKVHVGQGIRITGSTSYPGGNVEISDVVIGDEQLHADAGTSSDAIYLQALDHVTLSAFTIADAGESGIEMWDVDGTFSNGSITGGLDGVTASSDSHTTLSEVWIGEPSRYGLSTASSSVSARDLDIHASGSSGIYVDGGTAHDLDASTKVMSAGAWGMECWNNPAFLVCTAQLDGAYGPSSNCPCGG